MKTWEQFPAPSRDSSESTTGAKPQLQKNTFHSWGTVPRPSRAILHTQDQQWHRGKQRWAPFWQHLLVWVTLLARVVRVWHQLHKSPVSDVTHVRASTESGLPLQPALGNNWLSPAH